MNRQQIFSRLAQTALRPVLDRRAQPPAAAGLAYGSTSVADQERYS